MLQMLQCAGDVAICKKLCKSVCLAICCQDLKCIENCARPFSKYDVCLYCKLYNCDVK